MQEQEPSPGGSGEQMRNMEEHTEGGDYETPVSVPPPLGVQTVKTPFHRPGATEHLPPQPEMPSDPRFTPPIPPTLPPVDHAPRETIPPDTGSTHAGVNDAEELGAGAVSGKPVIYPKDHQPCDLYATFIDELERAKDTEHGPHVFNGGIGCVQLKKVGGRTEVIPLPPNKAGSALLGLILSLLFTFLFRRQGQGDAVPTSAPDKVVLSILADPSDLSRLDRITDIPPIRPDGTIVQQPGYDKETCTFYDPAGLRLDIPEQPTHDDVRRAVDTIRKPFERFPFVGRSGFANYAALLLTPLVRSLIDGNVPLLVVRSPTMGSGKSKLAACANIIATGRTNVTTTPKSDEEMHKTLLSVLQGKPQIVVIDNEEGKFGSTVLAAVLTTSTYVGRVLGKNEMREVPVHAAFVITGVNLEVTGDLPRRCYLVELDPECEKPEERLFDFDPEVYVKEHRPALIVALMTLIRFWSIQGKPGWGGKPFGSFECWTKVIGGILQAAGIEGFLENRDALANSDRDELALFYQGWRDVFGNAPQLSRDILALVRPKLISGHAMPLSPQGRILRDCLPEDILDIVDQKEGKATGQLAGVLRKYANRPAGGLKLVAGKDSHHKVRTWTVVSVDSGRDKKAIS